MPRRLTRRQPETLVQIVRFQARYGRCPTPGELAPILGIQRASASMRIRRLRETGYLLVKDDSDFVDGDAVVSQPATARFLLALADSKTSHADPVPFADLLALMDEAGITQADEEKRRLVRMMLKAGYLTEVRGWKGYYAPGPQIANERDYLVLLAALA